MTPTNSTTCNSVDEDHDCDEDYSFPEDNVEGYYIEVPAPSWLPFPTIWKHIDDLYDEHLPNLFQQGDEYSVINSLDSTPATKVLKQVADKPWCNNEEPKLHADNNVVQEMYHKPQNYKVHDDDGNSILAEIVNEDLGQTYTIWEEDFEVEEDPYWTGEPFEDKLGYVDQHLCYLIKDQTSEECLARTPIKDKLLNQGMRKPCTKIFYLPKDRGKY